MQPIWINQLISNRIDNFPKHNLWPLTAYGRARTRNAHNVSPCIRRFSVRPCLCFPRVAQVPTAATIPSTSDTDVDGGEGSNNIIPWPPYHPSWNAILAPWLTAVERGSCSCTTAVAVPRFLRTHTSQAETHTHTLTHLYIYTGSSTTNKQWAALFSPSPRLVHRKLPHHTTTRRCYTVKRRSHSHSDPVLFLLAARRPIPSLSLRRRYSPLPNTNAISRSLSLFVYRSVSVALPGLFYFFVFFFSYS